MGTKDNCNAKHKKVHVGRIETTTLISLDQEVVFLGITKLEGIIPTITYNTTPVWLFKDNLGKFFVTDELDVTCRECLNKPTRIYPVKEDEVDFEPDDSFEVLCRTCYYRKTQRLEIYAMVEGLK